ncbi:hypothetical protein D920_02141 [Enterococcus faecalis 13-SD-W-01]|nr:hypothetical protein D920_02141 [Enterococcus faecalis 13-SD-W-01]
MLRKKLTKILNLIDARFTFGDSDPAAIIDAAGSVSLIDFLSIYFWKHVTLVLYITIIYMSSEWRIAYVL